MKKVNLDFEYDKWREANISIITEKFLEIHNFEDEVEEQWRDYQRVNGLIDESNEDLK